MPAGNVSASQARNYIARSLRAVADPHPSCTALQTVTRLAAGLLTIASAPASWAGTTAEWNGGGGGWGNAALWGGTLPARTTEARINGTQDKPSQVILAHMHVLVTRLAVGDGGNSLASLILDGPSLTASGGMDVGKHTGSDLCFRGRWRRHAGRRHHRNSGRLSGHEKHRVGQFVWQPLHAAHRRIEGVRHPGGGLSFYWRV